MTRYLKGFTGVSEEENLAANARDMQETGFSPQVGKIPLEKEMATHSGILA